VSQGAIRRLYETDARGIYDDELIEEVGRGLAARCRSSIAAVAAVQGQARCPECSGVVAHAGRREELLRCRCGWELSWGDYFATIQRRQLVVAEPVLYRFRSFAQAFPKARAPQQKMMLIDGLIHAFHRYCRTGTPTRPVAVNLIEGRLSEVVAFLEELSRGRRSTRGVAENYGEWDRCIEVNRGWYASRRRLARDGRPQKQRVAGGQKTG
jgi:hypothetical protein